jgi:hypothetical protein
MLLLLLELLHVLHVLPHRNRQQHICLLLLLAAWAGSTQHQWLSTASLLLLLHQYGAFSHFYLTGNPALDDQLLPFQLARMCLLASELPLLLLLLLLGLLRRLCTVAAGCQTMLLLLLLPVKARQVPKATALSSGSSSSPAALAATRTMA